MAAAEPGQLEFRGEDATECETFINAVSRHALSIGKQRDDQWVADFASACFTHDALRWWNRLDDETQGSWKSLRNAMLSRYRPLFHGRSGEEAEKFIHMVRERAFDEEKQTDSHWLIGFASACFVGDALRWYASLEPRAQTDWITLQGALLAQYPRNAQGNLPNLIPTPAAAAASTRGIGVVSAPRTTRRGRIRVTKEGDSAEYYISKREFTSGDCLRLTSLDGDAMIVAWDWPYRDLQTLTITALEGDSRPPDSIGIRWTGLLGSDNLRLISLRRATAKCYSPGECNIDTFKGWKISGSAFGRGIVFDLTAKNEAGQTLYAILSASGNVLLAPERPYITAPLSLSLEQL